MKLIQKLRRVTCQFVFFIDTLSFSMMLIFERAVLLHDACLIRDLIARTDLKFHVIRVSLRQPWLKPADIV
jgi:hypothetical protein